MKYLVSEGQAVVDGKIVNINPASIGNKKIVMYRKMDDWWAEKVDLGSKRGTPLYFLEENHE